MSEIIKDGRGRGYSAEVNDKHQLLTEAVVQREESYIADKFGQTYVITTNSITLNSTNRHVLLYIKNNNTTKNLYHATLEVGYNGGSTNYNRSLDLQILAGFTGPTVNHTEAVFNNVNFTSGNTAEATGYKWDGVGDGMTISGGVVVNEAVFPAGNMIVETYGMPIMGFDDYLAISVKAEEIGKISVAIRLFYK